MISSDADASYGVPYIMFTTLLGHEPAAQQGQIVS